MGRNSSIIKVRKVSDREKLRPLWKGIGYTSFKKLSGIAKYPLFSARNP